MKKMSFFQWNFKRVIHLFFSSLLLLISNHVFAQRSGEKVTVTKSSIIDFKTIETYNRAHPYDPNQRRIAGIMNGGGEEDEEEMPKLKVPRNAKVMQDPYGKIASVNARNIPTDNGSALSPTPAIDFNGIDDNITTIPPDVGGQVGPNHVMTTLNSELRISTRTGAVVSTVTLNAFFASLGNPSTFDPKIVYDPYNSRWLITACANGQAANSALLMGASQTNDPTGAWNLYSIDVDAANTNWFDYPSIGFNKDWIVVTGNMFSISSNSFSAGRVYVYNKADLYAAAGSPGVTTINAGSSGFTLCPAVTYDNAISTMYLMQNYNGNFSGSGYIGLSTITGAIGSEVLSGTTFVSTPNPWASNAVTNFAPQSGTANKVACNDSRMQKTVYRNGKIWCTQTVFLPAASPTRSSIQWWQLSTAGAVLQRSRIDDASGTNFYAFPSIDVNQNDDALIGCAKFNATIFPSACYALRLNTDAVNTFQPDYLYKAGVATYFKTYGGSSNRWGDYSSVSVDPNDDLSFWTVQEYAKLPFGGFDAWGTWWANVALAVPVPATALNFDGADDYVSLGTTLGNFSSDFTIDLHVKTSLTQTYFICKRATCSIQNFISFGTDFGKLHFEIDDGAAGYAAITGSITVNNNAWHHVAVTRQSGKITLYVDGVANGTLNSSVSISNGFETRLGTSPCVGVNGFAQFSGSMDELRLWNRALCNAELQQYQNNELPFTLGNGLLAYYKFNQGNVNVNNSAITQAHDEVTNTNNGTLTNFALNGATSNWAQGTVTGSAPLFVGTDAGFHYRTVAAGNWSDAPTWEVSTDNINFFTACAPPGANALSVRVRTPHVVTVTANVTTVKTTVETGGTVNVNTGIVFDTH